ncbi:MAG: efflux RND transporter permease subunit [Saprospiraceae bacterium]|nr:efflux RND transporter permease subunit [Saprospiraceae bacterium]MBP6569252.1 efflux RND transporter permease subunit [Saprospiraceae bacterium]
MNHINYLKDKFKEFKPTSWSVDNRTAIYVITIIITLFGFNTFNTLPKEQFPDIVVPTISVTTVYVGNSPKDIENLVTRPIEKQIKGITGAKINKINSTSQTDFSLIIVEFDTDVTPEAAKQKVKDAVDKAKTDLPTDLTSLPDVLEFSFSDMPIMFVNISGDYDGIKLKQYAEKLQDRFEALPEINKADIVGAPEREFQINVDPLKMEQAMLSFDDVANAVAYENVDISGGQIEVGEMNRALRLKGQITSAQAIENLIIRTPRSGSVYLRDIATVKDTVKQKESYARLNGKNVITLNIVKRAGENLIECAGKVKDIVAEMKISELPQDLDVVVTADQSKQAATSFHELVNTIIIGFILVLVILMFFMGVVNAFFVALSVPLSVFVAFLFLPAADLIVGTDVTLNFIVLFALLFGLGIIVDDAIVVIENTHRIYENGKVPILKAAKAAAGEVFIPVLAGTATTIAPFFPLLFWKGIIGKFMIYLPTMLIFTLFASLIVAFIINPVFAVSFMKKEGKEFEDKKSAIFKKWFWYATIVIGIMLHLLGSHGMGNFALFMAAMAVVNRYLLRDAIHFFQDRLLPAMMASYEKLLRWILHGWRPVYMFASVFVMLIISFFLLVASKPDFPFFPSGQPNFIYVYLKLPVGTKAAETNKVLTELENKVYKTLEKLKPGEEGSIVESIISNVAVNAANPMDNNQSAQSNLGRIQVSFVEFAKRPYIPTAPYLDTIRTALKGIPGAQITVEQEGGGPPTDPPVNIEIAGDNFEDNAKVATDLYNFIDTNRVDGIDNLSMDVDLKNPEVTLIVDKERAALEGISTSQVGMAIRTALFGREVSKIKDGEDEYEIQLRYKDLVRNDINELINMRITFRDFNTGRIKQVPISAITKFDFTTTTGGIKRKDLKRTIQLQSNITDLSAITQINQEVAQRINEFKSQYQLPDGVTIKQSGESEQQAETNAFLGTALIIALGMIFLILVLQFNSLSKPFIVLSEILFSIIGVFLGFAITGMTMPTIMVMVGIIGLAGIVIKNGILLIEFTDELRSRGMKTREAAIQAGKIRIIPVLLTAIATILGLFPLAIGFNIDFESLFTHFDPKIFIGGDSVVFWGPLAWTIIFGLIFSFFLTLLVIPSMYLISERLRRPMSRFFGSKFVALLGFFGPFFFILPGIMYLVRRISGRKVWNGRYKS